MKGTRVYFDSFKSLHNGIVPDITVCCGVVFIQPKSSVTLSIHALYLIRELCNLALCSNVGGESVYVNTGCTENFSKTKIKQTCTPRPEAARGLVQCMHTLRVALFAVQGPGPGQTGRKIL